MAQSATVDNLDIEIGASLKGALAAITNLLSGLEKVTGKLSQLTSETKENTKANEEAAKKTDANVKAVAGLSASATKASKGLGKIAAAFKRIIFYRAIRTIIKNISSAVKEGLTNLKEYSSVVGTAFAPAVDNLRRHVLQLKNAFATALRPVIEALIPVVQKVVAALTQAADFVAQVLSVVTGKTDENGRYTKAILGDLEQSNKQAKELRRTLLGFDEINRLDGDTGSGSAQSSGLMFEQADVSEKAAGIAEKIKNFINTTDWETVLKVAAAVLGVVAAVKVGSKIVGAVKSVAGLLGGFGTALVAIAVWFAVDGDKISATMEVWKDKVDGFFSSLTPKTGTGKAVLDFVRNLAKDVIEFVQLMASAIYKLFHGDLEGALDDGKKILKLALKAIVHLVVGVVNIILGIVEDVVYGIELGAAWIWNNALAPVINWILTAVTNVKIWMHNAVLDIRIGFNTFAKWLMDKLNEWILQPLTEKINNVISFINDTLGTNIKPVDLTLDTSGLEAKIEELEGMKLEPLKETVQFVGKWENIQKPKLQIDVSAIDRAIDSIGAKVNRLGSSVSSIVNVTSGQANRSIQPIMRYASGGFPSVGSMFIAGEAGPEIVANINGRTGVMNTEQLSAAIYSAMNAALANNSQNGCDIYLDGEVIYRNTVRRNNNAVRATGRSALLT